MEGKDYSGVDQVLVFESLDQKDTAILISAFRTWSTQASRGSFIITIIFNHETGTIRWSLGKQFLERRLDSLEDIKSFDDALTADVARTQLGKSELRQLEIARAALFGLLTKWILSR
jgi:hypothetical protein